MKPYYLFALGPVASALQGVSSKYYNVKTKKANAFCNIAFMALAVILFFFFINKFRVTYNNVTFICGLGFGACYALCTIFNLIALKVGPISLTTLFLQFSLVLPVIFGIFFYYEYPGYLFYIAAALLAASILLIILKKSDGENKEAAVNPKWLLYAFISLFMNGGCCIVQTFHQRYWQKQGLDGHCKSEFMIFGMLFVIIFCIVGAFVTMRGWKKEEVADTVKNSMIYGGISGIMNGVLNLCTMIAVLHFDAKIVFPIMCGGALIVTILMSLILFKEKMTVKQWIGVGLGAVAIVLLNM